MVFFNKPRYVDSIRVISEQGFKVLFTASPMPSPKAHLMVVSTYVSNIGFVQKAFTCYGMTEASFKKFPFRKHAREHVRFALDIAGMKNAEYDQVKALLVGIAFETEKLDMAVNAIIMKVAKNSGYIIQPVGGFSLTDVVNNLLPNSDRVRPNAAPPPTDPAKQPDTAAVPVVKKQRFH